MPDTMAFTSTQNYDQLELGADATPFEYRPLTMEEQLCYRYYQYYGTVNQCGTATNAPIRWGGLFYTEFRATPTITTAGSGTSSWGRDAWGWTVVISTNSGTASLRTASAEL